MKNKFSKLLLLGLVIFPFITPVSSYAIENGGIGGVPAFPDSNNSRTKSIFIHTSNPGDVINEGLIVINNYSQNKTIDINAVDSENSSDGAFACKQNIEKKNDVGSWIKLDKSEVLLTPVTQQLVKFTINVPKNADVGEHDGCITMQDKVENTTGSGVVLNLRSAIRVAITIPGEITRKLSSDSLTITKNGDNLIDLSTKVKNEGNVSIDAKVSVQTNTLWGSQIENVGDEYSILRDNTAQFSFEQTKPFWGGWYKYTPVITYDSDNAAVIGKNTNSPLTTIYGETQIVFSMPSRRAIVIEIAVPLILILLIVLLIRRSKGKKKLKIKA